MEAGVNKRLQERIEGFMKGWVMFNNLVFLGIVLGIILLVSVRMVHVFPK